MKLTIVPRVETSVRELSIRVYLDEIDDQGKTRQSDNYDAVCSVFIYGKRAFVYNLHGGGFYLALAQLFEALLKITRIDTLEGFVLPSHARLLKRELKKLEVKSSYSSPVESYGRKMIWFTICLNSAMCKP
jgi:hypothetical protein